MSDEWTPTTEYIRGYIHEGALAEFNRWLTAHDAEIRSAAVKPGGGNSDSTWGTSTTVVYDTSNGAETESREE